MLIVALASGLAADTASFNVRAFGAAGDGATLDTKAINAAMDAASKAGGGTVVLPAGTYLSGTVRLRSNITLWLEPGATLRGTKDLMQYQTAVEGQVWYDALVLAKGVSNVAIAGRGVIDGNKVRNPKGEERMRGPHAVLLYEVRDASIRDVSIRDAGNYNVTVRSTENLTIDGITARGGWDGINMHDTRGVTIANCHLYTGDDSLAGAYWENVTVTNCILNSSANAIRVGGRNVMMDNLVIFGPGEYPAGTSQRHKLEAGFQILPQRAFPPDSKQKHLVAAGSIDNMVISNTTIINAGTPIYIAYSGDAPYSANSLGVGRIVFNNITVSGGGLTPIYISAPQDRPAKSIELNHVRMRTIGGVDQSATHQQGFSPFSVMAAYGVYGRNVERLELNDVRIETEKPDLRTAVMADNVRDLVLNRFDTQRAEGGAPSIQRIGERTAAAQIPAGLPVSAPFLEFKNTTGEARKLDQGFYIRAAGDYPLQQFGDQYAAVYLAKALPERASVMVKLTNPELRTNWVGRTGIVVRSEISKPDQSTGYVILAASPAAGVSLEWDGDGNGRLDEHTNFDGYTIWPVWLKLDREGNHFTGYQSRDGEHWETVGTCRVPGAVSMLDAGMFAYRDSALFGAFRIRL